MFRNQEEISNLLDTFATWNRCFTIRDVSEWSGEVSDLGQLRQAFCADSRFVPLSQPGGQEWFLPERSLFHWWANFNLRLATIGQQRLTERHLAASLNSLLPEGIWSSLPVDVLEYAYRFGFVAPAWTSGFYVFPMAHVLSQVSPNVFSIFRKVFSDFASTEDRNVELQIPLDVAVESCFSTLTARNAHILKVREGLPPYQRMTLEQLGSYYGCTRERIRQIEARSWRRIWHPSRSSLLAPSLLAEIMKRQGSLIFDTEQEITTYTCFVAKCLRIPFARTKLGNHVALGVSDPIHPYLDRELNIAETIDPNIVAEELDGTSLHYLAGDDLYRIAEPVVELKYSRLNRAEKVYLALRDIGKPAHYSEVAETFNSLFPDDPMLERNVHAVLSRCADPNLEQFGIVWVRIKGTYALKEHGYERPNLGIHEAVAKIVEEKYAETGRPVHVSVIGTELGRDKRLVDPASFAFATGANERLEQVIKDYFIPKSLDQENTSQATANDLDGVLRQFRATYSE